MSESFQLDLRLYNDLVIPLSMLEHCKDDFITDVTFDDLCNWSIAYLYHTKYDGKRNLKHLNEFCRTFELCKLSCKEVYDSFFEKEIKGEKKRLNTEKMFDTMFDNLKEKEMLTRDYLFNYCVLRFTSVFKPLVFNKWEANHNLTNFMLKSMGRVMISHEK